MKLVDKSQIKMNKDKCGILKLKIKPKVKTKNTNNKFLNKIEYASILPTNLVNPLYCPVFLKIIKENIKVAGKIHMYLWE